MTTDYSEAELILAHHEAAHAVAAIAAGISVDNVQMGSPLFGSLRGHVTVQDHSVDSGELAVVLCAGRAAEEHWCARMGILPNHRNWEGDERDLERVLSRHRMTTEHALRMARALVIGRWGNVEGVAEYLLAKRKITGKQAARAAR